MMECLDAYTENSLPYPQYVNFSRNGDFVVISLRSPPDEEGACGSQAQMRMPVKEFKKMMLKTWAAVGDVEDEDELA